MYFVLSRVGQRTDKNKFYMFTGVLLRAGKANFVSWDFKRPEMALVAP